MLRGGKCNEGRKGAETSKERKEGSRREEGKVKESDRGGGKSKGECREESKNEIRR